MMHFFYQCCCESSLPQGLERAAACQGASRAGSLQEMVYMGYRSLSTVFGVCVLWLRKAVFTPCEKNTFKQVIAFVCLCLVFLCIVYTKRVLSEALSSANVLGNGWKG